jgi:hypothetical protein
MQVIDSTYNFTQEIQSSTKPYLHVIIYTKTIEDAPQVNNLGDIIYLKRFKVQIKLSLTILVF